MKREDAKQVEVLSLGFDLGSVVSSLIKAREHGENIYTIFNCEHKLYSCDVTMDSAYKEVCGCSKQVFDKRQAKVEEDIKRQQEKEEQQAINNIPHWIEKGKKYIDESLLADWEECVNIRARDLHGTELDYLLEILEVIKNGSAVTKQDIEKILNKQNHSGMSYGLMKSMLKTFSKEYKDMPEKKEELDKEIGD